MKEFYIKKANNTVKFQGKINRQGYTMNSFLNFLSKQRYLFLLLALLAFFIIPPSYQDAGGKSLTQFFIASMVPVLGVYLSSKYKHHILISFCLGILAYIAIINFKDSTSSVGVFISGFFAILNYSFVVYIILLNILKEERVNHNTIYGGISVYLFLGFMWGILYNILVRFDSASFSHSPENLTDFTLIYYSFITLTTVGYGEIHPVSQMARNLAMLEAIVGQLYLTILIAILVGKFIVNSMERNEERIFTEKFLRYILRLNNSEQKKLLQEIVEESVKKKETN